MLKIGCCGFPVAQETYFKQFSTIEIQQSFYRTLGIKQVENWSKKAPIYFEFVLKAPQYITHFPNSPTYRRADLPQEKRKYCGGFKLNTIIEQIMETFFDRAAILKAKKFVFQTPASFKPAAMKNLVARNWPGNIRELENVIERAVILCQGEYIELTDIEPLVPSKPQPSFNEILSLPFKKAKKQVLLNFYHQYLNHILAQCGGNISQAAQRCGVKRQYFYRLLKLVEINHKNRD